ncbi:MAG: hypothetical protein ACREL2_04080 [Gemmatimonadales bacterium]
MRPFDRLRFALTVTGLAIGIVGITRDDRHIVWAAIGCLAVAFVLRFGGRRASHL